jgi:hypothetical protein
MYRFIQNTGDFFAPGYYTEDFASKVIALSGYDSDAIKEFNSRFPRLKTEYFDFKSKVKDSRLHSRYIIKETHDFNTKLMEKLGYDTSPAYADWIYIDDNSVIPARSILRNGSQTRLVILEMQAMVKAHDDDVPAGLFEQQYDDTGDKVKEQKYLYSQWAGVISRELPEGCSINPSKINECVTAIFGLPMEQRPQYIVIFAGNMVFVVEQDKWDHGAYLVFDLEELFSEASISANRNYYALFYLLASKEVLAGDAQIVLMDRIAEEAYKNTYEVTKDLKNGVIKAVELLANEAIYYKREVLKESFDETSEFFAGAVKDDCLTIIYRLLFIFYAEARPEIGILPMDDQAYAKGYSLDILRDLEQTPLRSQQSQNSYFFHDSLWTLFELIRDGHNDSSSSTHVSFSVKKIDSPLFNDESLTQLKGVKFRSKIWQEIICSLSLSEEKSRKSRGRISYATLGINQLGSVYESLLAYRGFYAKEDYIEVHPKDKEDETYLVQRSRMADFKEEEILRDRNGNMEILPKGQFVYRLNGRDRKKSASYYTPEVLTKSTVKYTLKGFVEKLDNGEMKAEDLLKLKILEPAMGAAAFQNEVINQVAELYLMYRQRERGIRISPHLYRDELQKVKAYIATKNIYGVDLNPTAIELGKLSLWLNVIHKDMETPFFGHRLALGNAVIGAWFKAYNENELCKIEHSKYVSTEWWDKAPHLLHFSKDTKKLKRKPGEIYHFLIPDKNMLGVLNIKEEKNAHPEAAAQLKKILKDWTEPITKENIQILKKISAKIDGLIRECVIHQQKVDSVTQNRYSIWGHTDRTYESYNFDAFDDKQSISDSRNLKGNAFFKLRTVLDYWCSLWFWEYGDAKLLPTRTEYWQDIAEILGINLSGNDNSLVQTTRFEEANLFNQPTEEESAVPEAAEERIEEDIPTYTREDAEAELKKVRTETKLFENGYRIPVVQRLAERYRFFHPMLEFIEVFWLRDGFDIICGNPPWLKLEFEEIELIAEKYPEVAIRKMIAPKVREIKERLLCENTEIKELYDAELTENTCTGTFLNGYSNYPLLVGQQTNLYKCILVNGFDLLSGSGYMGLLHPETVFDDPKGQPLRRELYKRLKYHFQFQNELRLFAEVDHHTKYGDQLYGPRSSSPDFLSIHNLYHPSTIDACFAHDGHGVCGGAKSEDGSWNTAGHKDRIVRFTEKELRILSDTFEEGADWESTKLISTQSRVVLKVLEKMGAFPKHVRDFNPLITVAFDETGAVDAGIIKRETYYPNVNSYEMVYNGPQFFYGNPYYKTPRTICKLNSDYDCIDTNVIGEDYIARSNYKPVLPIIEYTSQIKGFKTGEDIEGNPIYDNWIDHYKLGFRKMVGPDSEHTLICAVLPRKTAHINGVISSTFTEDYNTVDMAGLCTSLPLDFWMKIMASQNLTSVRLKSFPMGVDSKHNSAIRSRILLLNCLSIYYSDLWKKLWHEGYKLEQWSISDARLKPFSSLSSVWNSNTPLRNSFERRQAQIELDVIAAIALGLTLDDLETMYSIQFGVLQKYDNDTWYDAKGNIVFTVNAGLKGVGVDRSVWEFIRGNLSEDGLTYSGTAPTYEHTIDPAKSELYGGQKVTYCAPYNRCDRIADYRTAWAHFEKIFNDKS